jgi:hypothetical protein
MMSFPLSYWLLRDPTQPGSLRVSQGSDPPEQRSDSRAKTDNSWTGDCFKGIFFGLPEIQPVKALAKLFQE